MASRKKLIIGNWKMNPTTLKDAKKIFNDFKKKRYQDKNITTVVCPPYIYLSELKKSYTGKKIFFGAQDAFWKKEGSFTRQISPEMLSDIGVRFVILGHSEVRALGENNEMIAQKVKACLTAGLHVVLCVGEPERDHHGYHLKFIKEELKDSLRGVSNKLIKKLIIAYEPIWAIGKGKKAMESREIHQMYLYVKKNLMEIYGKKVGDSIPIIYGGSVNSDNASEIVWHGHVDGLLPGRASLNPHEFSAVIDVVSRKI